MSVVDELRELAAGATSGAPVPLSAQVRDVCTRAADELARIERLRFEYATDRPGTAVENAERLLAHAAEQITDRRVGFDALLELARRLYWQLNYVLEERGRG